MSIFELLYNDSYSGFSINNATFIEYKARGGKASHTHDSDNLRNDPILIELYKELGSEVVSGDSSSLNIYQSDKDYTNYYRIYESEGAEEVIIDEGEYIRDQIKCILSDKNKTKDQKLDEISKL